MSETFKDYINLNKAATLLSSDWPSHPIDTVFFFGRSYFDAGKRDLFKIAADMIARGYAKAIIIPGSEGQRLTDPTPRLANPGMTLWTNRLISMSVPKEKILYGPLPDEEVGFHTKLEGDSFVKVCSERGYTTAVSLTQPHQSVRTMLGLVKTINEQNLPIDVWAIFPKNVDWNKQVRGSQGQEKKPRWMHIEDEANRIFTYQVKGDLASFEELFTYLEKRVSNKF